MKKLCKHELPEVIIKNVEACTLSYGKVKLVLKHNRYFIESSHSDVVQKLLKDKTVQSCILDEKSDNFNAPPGEELSVPEEKKPKIDLVEEKKPSVVEAVPAPTTDEDIDKFYDKIMGEEEDENAEAIRKLEILTFEIKPDTIEAVQKRCIEMDYPLLAEYDFRNDTQNPNLGIDLKASTKLRYLCVVVPFLL